MAAGVPGEVLRVAILSGLLVAGAAAQGAETHFPPQKDLQVSFRESPEDRGGEGAVQLRTRGLPARTSILLKLTLDGGEVPSSWRRGLVAEGGGLAIPLGPFQAKLLPGSYELELELDPRQQDVTLDRFFEKWPPQKVIARYTWAYRVQEEAAARIAYRKKLLDLADSGVKLLDEVIEAGDAYRAGKRFREGGQFAQESFLEWANRVAETLAGDKKFIEQLPQAHLAPYDPQVVRFEFPNLYLMLRFAAIDYTIFPILKREGVPVPERFQMLTGMAFKPDRRMAIEKARALDRQIRKALSGSPAGKLLELIPPEPRRPTGFQVVEQLEGHLAGVVSANPGATPRIDDKSAQAIAQKLGVSLSPADLEELALLALAPGGKGEPVVLYLFRFKREFYGELLVQQLQKQRELGKFAGWVLRREDIVAVADGPAEPPHRGAARSLATYLSSEQKFKQE